MQKLNILNQEGTNVGEFELNESIFSGPINKTVMAETMHAYLNNIRRGTAKTKERGEVRGGGAKPWRQKGTGRARVGSIRSPLWRGGAVIFGPRPRDWSYKLPKKVINLALCSTLRDKLSGGHIKVLDEIKFKEAKTKYGVELLKKLGVSGKILFILPEIDKNVLNSLKNIKRIKIISIDMITIYNLLDCGEIITTTKALKKIEELLG